MWGNPPKFARRQSERLGNTRYLDFTNRVAVTPCTLSAGANRSIYQNGFSSIDGVLSSATPANDYLLLALADGNVLEYADSAQSWVASRKISPGPGGAYRGVQWKFISGWA